MKPLTQAAALRRKCSRLLSSHKQRAKQLGQALDYGLDDLIALVSDSPQCAYCKMPLGLDVSIDHQAPIARGGSLGLWNLVACCRPCNKAKGQLSRPEFEQLLELLKDFHPAAQQDVLRRLRAGGKRYEGKRGPRRPTRIELEEVE